MKLEEMKQQAEEQERLEAEKSPASSAFEALIPERFKMLIEEEEEVRTSPAPGHAIDCPFPGAYCTCGQIERVFKVDRGGVAVVTHPVQTILGEPVIFLMDPNTRDVSVRRFRSHYTNHLGAVEL